jgi:hypothetical protein
MNKMLRHPVGTLVRKPRARIPGRKPAADDIQACFAQVEAALQRIERAVSRFKAEAALARVEHVLRDVSLVPKAEPVEAERSRSEPPDRYNFTVDCSFSYPSRIFIP